jgi:hypothetical protein
LAFNKDHLYDIIEEGDKEKQFFIFYGKRFDDLCREHYMNIKTTLSRRCFVKIFKILWIYVQIVKFLCFVDFLNDLKTFFTKNFFSPKNQIFISFSRQNCFGASLIS